MDNYLLDEQYKDDVKLAARRALFDLFSTNRYDFQRWVFDHFQLPAHAKILELGCGAGSLWVKNGERTPPGWHTTLSDFSEGMFAAARKNLAGCPNPFHFQVIDAASIPYPDETFDAMIANHMLYHVPHRAQALQEIQRVLKPEGTLYASTVGEGHIRVIDALAIEFDLAEKDFSRKGFTLENGAAQLSPWFTRVAVEYHDNALEVTDTSPLIAYIQSTRPPLGDEVSHRLRERIQKIIDAQGSFHVSTSTGMFIARK